MQDDRDATRSSLLTRLRDWDDETTWNQFFSQYSSLIRTVAGRLGLSEADINDVVQETIIALANQIQTFHYNRADGSFRGLLAQIARRRAIDLLRKRSREAHQPLGDQSGMCKLEKFREHAVPTPDQIWTARWKEGVYDLALEEVRNSSNPKHFQIFDLYVIQGRPPVEIAQTLRVSRAQVYIAKQRISLRIQKEVRRLKQHFDPVEID
jgi:RNA polymerase sigma factor (sigma-70 family)